MASPAHTVFAQPMLIGSILEFVFGKDPSLHACPKPEEEVVNESFLPLQHCLACFEPLLDYPSLLNCGLVNRHWYVHTMPILWWRPGRYDWDEFSLNRLMRLVGAGLEGQKKKERQQFYADHVRYGVLETYPRPRVWCDEQLTPESMMWLDQDAIWDISFPKLKSLRIEVDSDEKEYSPKCGYRSGLLPPMTQSLPCMEEVELSPSAYMQVDNLLRQIVKLCPALRKLETRSNLESTAGNVNELKRMPNLKEWPLIGSDIECYNRIHVTSQ